MKFLVAKAHWDTLTHFVYVPDKVLHPDHFDRWISYADQVEQGEIFKGDCDDMALTTAELADPARGRSGSNKADLLPDRDRWGASGDWSGSLDFGQSAQDGNILEGSAV